MLKLRIWGAGVAAALVMVGQAAATYYYPGWGYGSGGGSSSASYEDCHYSILGNVAGALDCEISSETDTSTAAVNSGDGFFGFTDWEYAASSSSWYASGKDGYWDISGIVTGSFDDILVVFEDSHDNELVGYIMGDATGIDWSSPFTPNAFGFHKTKDVKKISVYYRQGGGSTTVSAPAGLGLLGLVALGVGISRRRAGEATA